MKKSLFTGLALACAVSGGAEAHGLKKDQFYVGGGLSYSHFFDQTFGVATAGRVAAATNGNVNARLSQKKTAGGLGFGGFAGYRWDFGNSYLAELEALAQLQDTSLENGRVADNASINKVSIEMTKKETFGLMGRLGKEISDTQAISLGLGLVSTRFSTNLRGVNGNSPGDQSVTKDKYAWGLRFGAGYTHDLTSQWALRADYAYTTYRKFSVAGRTYSRAGLTYDTSMNPAPSDHMLMFSLAYGF